MTQLTPDLKPWYQMRGRFDEIVLKAGDDSYVKKLKNCYYPRPIKDEIKRDTIFWYEPGRYGSTKEQMVMAGILLKGVIPEYVQKATFDALHGMTWRKPRRVETVPAIKLQRGQEVEAAEMIVGYSGAVIEYAAASRRQAGYVNRLEPILRSMDGIFGKVLPQQHANQTKVKLLRDRKVESNLNKGKRPQVGGIPYRYRLFLTSFSTLALLRSCPTAIHRDANARPDEMNFSCLTTIRGPKKFKGGGFCLPEYELRIPVLPGDLLIAQTSKEWHCNVGAVEGLKYSIVAYYKTRLANTNVAIDETTVPKETEELKAIERTLEYVQEYRKESDARVKKRREEKAARDKIPLTEEEMDRLQRGFEAHGYKVTREDK